MNMMENMILVRCQNCGFGNRVKDGSTLMICGKCGANPRVSEVKRVGR